MSEVDRLRWNSSGSIIAEILDDQTTLSECRHHINIPPRPIVESIATIPSVIQIELDTLIERSVTKVDRSHIDRMHDLQLLKRSSSGGERVRSISIVNIDIS